MHGQVYFSPSCMVVPADEEPRHARDREAGRLATQTDNRIVSSVLAAVSMPRGFLLLLATKACSGSKGRGADRTTHPSGPSVLEPRSHCHMVTSQLGGSSRSKTSSPASWRGLDA